MAWIQDFPGVGELSERTEKAWRAPLGAASPLWMVFGAAASSAVAYWWFTRWARNPVNLEATMAARATSAEASPRRIEILAEPEPTSEAPAGADVAPLEAVIEAPPPASVADDLTRLTGIGPKLSVALAARGVTRFAQIAAWTKDDLAEVDAALNLKGRAVREAWVAQAKRLAGA